MVARLPSLSILDLAENHTNASAGNRTTVWIFGTLLAECHRDGYKPFSRMKF